MRLALRLAFLWIALLCLLQIVSVSAQESGYTYTVQPGDSWPLVAQRFGLTVNELQAANPDAVRANGWLIIGEILFIPRAPDWEEKFYIVQRGDGWTTVAERFGLTVELLQGANPKAQSEDDSLIVGRAIADSGATADADRSANRQVVPYGYANTCLGPAGHSFFRQ